MRFRPPAPDECGRTTRDPSRPPPDELASREPFPETAPRDPGNPEPQMKAPPVPPPGSPPHSAETAFRDPSAPCLGECGADPPLRSSASLSDTATRAYPRHLSRESKHTCPEGNPGSSQIAR